ncbi:MAG: hypothetical protein WDW38_005354 [Sanguina aurantia]
MLQLKHHQRRGRGLYTTRKVLAGETVFQEDPMLLLVAQSMAQQACANCLKLITPQRGPFPCSACQQSCFCSSACQASANAHPEVHGEQICRGYAALASAAGLTAEELDQGRFLLHALQLRGLHLAAADPRYGKLLQLEGQPTAADLAAAAHIGAVLQPTLASSSAAGCSTPDSDPASNTDRAQLSPAGSTDTYTPATPATAAAAAAVSPPSLEEVATLLRKEQLNSYGILGPNEARGERRLRGSAVYIDASMVNHECTPTAARFDAFDSDAPGSTRVSFRALHDLPEGTEVTQSYCPLNWSYADRQQQCNDVYGFSCSCSRCQAVPNTYNLPVNSAPDDPPYEDTYVHLYLLKYLCPVPECYGTLAPTEPGSTAAECNVCGGLRTDAQFLADLDKDQAM